MRCRRLVDSLQRELIVEGARENKQIATIETTPSIV